MDKRALRLRKRTIRLEIEALASYIGNVTYVVFTMRSDRSGNFEFDGETVNRWTLYQSKQLLRTKQFELDVLEGVVSQPKMYF